MVLSHLPPTNLDMLAWFSEDERSLCKSCGQRAAVSLPEADTCFCLGCAAITIDGVRIDGDRSIAVSRSDRR
jgi:hypothetical protein